MFDISSVSLVEGSFAGASHLFESDSKSVAGSSSVTENGVDLRGLSAAALDGLHSKLAVVSTLSDAFFDHAVDVASIIVSNNRAQSAFGSV